MTRRQITLAGTGFEKYTKTTRRVQFLAEMVVVEITAPTMRRRPDPDLYNVPLLTFEVEA